MLRGRKLGERATSILLARSEKLVLNGSNGAVSMWRYNEGRDAMQCSPYLKSALVLLRIRHAAKQSDANSAFTEGD